MSTLTEQIHLDQTQAFIDLNPSDLVAYRSARTPDGRGGSTLGSATAVAAFCGRMVGHQLQRGDVRAVPDGNQVSLTYTCVMMPDVDVQLGDEIEYDGKRFVVENISTSPPWRRTAGLVAQS